MRVLFLLKMVLILSIPFSLSHATSLYTPENLYFNPQRKNKPEAIIFYNSNNPCFKCQESIELLLENLKENYQHQMSIYLINLATNSEFISTFDLQAPLTLVIINISDGASFGYQKLTGLQSDINNPQYFKRRVNNFINNFLNFNTKN